MNFSDGLNTIEKYKNMNGNCKFTKYRPWDSYHLYNMIDGYFGGNQTVDEIFRLFENYLNNFNINCLDYFKTEKEELASLKRHLNYETFKIELSEKEVYALLFRIYFILTKTSLIPTPDEIERIFYQLKTILKIDDVLSEEEMEIISNPSSVSYHVAQGLSKKLCSTHLSYYGDIITEDPEVIKNIFQSIKDFTPEIFMKYYVPYEEEYVKAKKKIDEWYNKYKKVYPSTPGLPNLNINKTMSEEEKNEAINSYIDDMKEYEIKKAEFDDLKQKYYGPCPIVAPKLPKEILYDLKGNVASTPMNVSGIPDFIDIKTLCYEEPMNPIILKLREYLINNEHLFDPQTIIDIQKFSHTIFNCVTNAKSNNDKYKSKNELKHTGNFHMILFTNEDYRLIETYKECYDYASNGNFEKLINEKIHYYINSVLYLKVKACVNKHVNNDNMFLRDYLLKHPMHAYVQFSKAKACMLVADSKRTAKIENDFKKLYWTILKFIKNNKKLVAPILNKYVCNNLKSLPDKYWKLKRVDSDADNYTIRYSYTLTFLILSTLQTIALHDLKYIKDKPEKCYLGITEHNYANLAQIF